MDNAQGGHELLHLQTSQVVKIPMPPSIIKQVHALAVLDDMPLGLKITNRANNVMFDTASIAEVDHDEEEFEDENYEDVDNNYEDVEDNEDYDKDDEDGYDEMDANELADILQEPNEFQVPHKTENKEVVFEEPANEAEDLNEDVDEDYDPDDNNEADMLLEADDEDGEQEDNQGMR
jgi:hypothetical protein